MQLDLTIPEKALFLFSEKARYKVLYGGRGSAKSWSAARALIIKALTNKIRVLCTREYQSAIKDSVHKLLKDQIYEQGLTQYFHITKADRDWETQYSNLIS